MEVITIVPRLPPLTDGVGDYALRMAEQLRLKYRIETRFIVADPQWHSDGSLFDFPTLVLDERTPEALCQLLVRERNCGSSALLIHLSGYGYAKWSLYDWLVKGLKQWKLHVPDSSLITMFHELYNTPSWPWSHRFWTAHRQKKLASQMLELSDRCITSCQRHVEMLENLSSKSLGDIPNLPVFSNIGEAPFNQPMALRKRQLVIFGLASSRNRAYQKSGPIIEQLCQQLSLEAIIDIGQPTHLPLDDLFQTPVLKLGHQPAEAISEILQESMLGWLNYTTNHIEKSGIFAAYAAHGVVPILDVDSSQDCSSNLDSHFLIRSDQVKLGREFVNSHDSLQRISDKAYTWYQKHSIENHTEIFKHAILG